MLNMARGFHRLSFYITTCAVLMFFSPCSSWSMYPAHKNLNIPNKKPEMEKTINVQDDTETINGLSLTNSRNTIDDDLALAIQLSLDLQNDSGMNRPTPTTVNRHQAPQSNQPNPKPPSFDQQRNDYRQFHERRSQARRSLDHQQHTTTSTRQAHRDSHLNRSSVIMASRNTSVNTSNDASLAQQLQAELYGFHPSGLEHSSDSRHSHRQIPTPALQRETYSPRLDSRPQLSITERPHAAQAAPPFLKERYLGMTQQDRHEEAQRLLVEMPDYDGHNKPDTKLIIELKKWFYLEVCPTGLQTALTSPFERELITVFSQKMHRIASEPGADLLACFLTKLRVEGHKEYQPVFLTRIEPQLFNLLKTIVRLPTARAIIFAESSAGTESCEDNTHLMFGRLVRTALLHNALNDLKNHAHYSDHPETMWRRLFQAMKPCYCDHVLNEIFITRTHSGQAIGTQNISSERESVEICIAAQIQLQDMGYLFPFAIGHQQYAGCAKPKRVSEGIALFLEKVQSTGAFITYLCELPDITTFLQKQDHIVKDRISQTTEGAHIVMEKTVDSTEAAMAEPYQLAASNAIAQEREKQVIRFCQERIQELVRLYWH
ncbi:hypothetical protein CI610_02205 [invertebrate metagenome]|uniref:NEL domain-containing protein n=1 Tax=invertebrate metagenome TaxID=1711999 RepID=A0A2H9T6J8_9ZZZZ